MGAGGRRMMGAEAAVGAMEQAPCSVGVGSEDVLRGILAGGGGVEDGEGRDDWGGEGGGFWPRNCMERCCAGSGNCMDVHRGVKRPNALGFVRGCVHLFLVIH